MDYKKKIHPGLSREETFTVEENHAASHVGSGGSRVLATPWMIAFMERVAYRLLKEHLGEGESSVGVLIDVRHLAPTPIGANIRVKAVVELRENSQITFTVTAWDQFEKIGAGRHQRVVIDEERFLRRVSAKQ
jgi:fluoroacetyl-CoA thioesterase